MQVRNALGPSSLLFILRKVLIIAGRWKVEVRKGSSEMWLARPTVQETVVDSGHADADWQESPQRSALLFSQRRERKFEIQDVVP